MKNQSYFVRTMIGLAILALAGAMATAQDSTANSSMSDQFGDAKGSPIYGLITNNNNPDGDSISLYALEGNGLDDLSTSMLIGGGQTHSQWTTGVFHIPQYFCSVVINGADPNAGYPYGSVQAGHYPTYFSINGPPPFTVVQTIAPPYDSVDQIQWTTLQGTLSYFIDTYPTPTTWVSLVFTQYGYVNSQEAINYQVNSDCSLTAGTPPEPLPFDPVERMIGISRKTKSSYPGGVIAYQDQQVGSYALVDGKVIQHGPYPSKFPVADVQVTSDSRFALFTGNDDAGAPLVEVYPIKRDNSLGAETDYPGLGTGVGSNSILVSPDERFLFIGNFASGQITTLNFNKKTGAVSYACSSNVLNGFQTIWGTTEGMATETTTGAGGYLYVAENAGGLSANSSIGVVAIDENTGCTSEISGSPFANPNAPGSFSIASATFKSK